MPPKFPPARFPGADDDSDSDADMVGPPPPPPAGAGAESPGSSSEGMIGPPPPPPGDGDGDGSDDGEDLPQQVLPAAGVVKARFFGDEDEDEDEDEGEDAGGAPAGSKEALAAGLPVSNEAQLTAHDRSVTALGLDPSGSRLVTGGRDSKLVLFDFAGMDSRLRPFRELEEAVGAQALVEVDWNARGSGFLAVAADAQIHLFDRDGRALGKTVKGDQYLMDMNNTKGHVAAATEAHWHAERHNEFVSVGRDGTIRLWDAQALNRNVALVRVRSDGFSASTKIPVTSACWGPSRSVFVGGEDGALQLFSQFGRSARPALRIARAHQPGWVSRVALAPNGHLLASRAYDHTLKLWDTRYFDKPVAVFGNLPNMHEETDCSFSPSGDVLVTGTSVARGTPGRGLLVFVGTQTLEQVHQLGVSDASVIRSVWHSRLNQIFVGCADHTVRVLYNADSDVKSGVIRALGRKPRRRDPSDGISSLAIYTPNARIELQDERYLTKRDLEKLGRAPKKVLRPEKPLVSEPLNTVDTSLVRGGRRNDIDIDVREAILRHADAAEQNPLYSKAYEKTQPKPIFDMSGLEQPEDAGNERPEPDAKRAKR